MVQNNRNGEVSEVIFGVRNRLDALNCFARSRALSVFCVRNLSAHKCGSSTLRESRNLFNICRKSCPCRCLDLFRSSLVSARLARLGEVRVLGITSPAKPMKTLGFLAKARLARLFLPMPTHVRAHVRTSGPTTRLPKWHSDAMYSPCRMGPPTKNHSSEGRGNGSNR